MGALLLLWNRQQQGLGLLGICIIPHPPNTSLVGDSTPISLGLSLLVSSLKDSRKGI